MTADELYSVEMEERSLASADPRAELNIRRRFAWWRLRAFLSEQLTAEEFRAILEPLNELLHPPLSSEGTPMAFDAMPSALGRRLMAELTYMHSSGKLDREVIRKVEGFAREILDVPERVRGSPAVIEMRKMHRQLFDAGVIKLGMGCREQHRRVLGALVAAGRIVLDKTSRPPRSYTENNFRITVEWERLY
jgi:hypothetical protein